MDDYEGSKYKIVHCEGAEDSFYEELGKHVQRNKHPNFKARMRRMHERLADGHRMSNENFPKEGKLPDGTHFRALKRIPLRAYIWQSKKHSGTFFTLCRANWNKALFLADVPEVRHDDTLFE